MAQLVDLIRNILKQHPQRDPDDGVGTACGCGAQGVGDHSGHVAEEIVNSLALRPHNIDDVPGKIRYISARFDEELTKLEGAE